MQDVVQNAVLQLQSDYSNYDEIVVCTGDGSATLFPGKNDIAAVNWWYNDKDYNMSFVLLFSNSTATFVFAQRGSSANGHFLIIGKKY